MARTMYDAIHALVPSIPSNAQIVAGYLPPSPYAWTADDWARFPNAVHVRIAVRAATNDGVVLDVEQGDATPAEAPGWVRMRRAAGVDPTVYCSASTQAVVQREFAAQGVAQPHYWVASYPGGGAVIPSGAIAHQYQSTPQYDISAVADYWPGVDTTPGGLDMATTDPLPVRRPDGSVPTVGEALGNLYIGAYYGGVSTGGPSEYAQLAAIAATQAKVAGAVAALTTAVTAVDTDIKAAAAQEAADHAAALAAIGKVSAIDPTALAADLHAALTAVGWTAPPTADQVATTTATAVLALIQSRLAGGTA